jgi:lipoprotein-anchoring transpeptidase ErfK/SrfK
MQDPTRRLFLAGTGLVTAFGLAGCNTTAPAARVQVAALPVDPNLTDPTPVEPSPDNVPASSRFKALYGSVPGDRFPIPALKAGTIPEPFWRTEVDYTGKEPAGTVVVDPRGHYLYHVQANNRAMRYGVGVGREGFRWNGVATINSKQEWPDWYPPKEMIERQPEIQKVVTKLQGGQGMAGGPRNPLGARAMYLWQNNKDTLFRIHGTVEPWTIGKNVSSGCIRMVNQDAIHLYNSVAVGSRVVVLA